MDDCVTRCATFRITDRSRCDVNIASIICHLIVVSVTREVRRDRTRLHDLAPLLQPRTRIVFPNLKRIVVLENDHAFVARECSVNFVAKPDHLFVSHTKWSILVGVEENEPIAIDAKSLVRRAESRLVRMTTRIVMSIMIADQGMERRTQLTRHVLKKIPLRVSGMLNVVSGKLYKVRLDEIVNLIHHPKGCLIVGTVRELKMQITWPDKGYWFFIHEKGPLKQDNCQQIPPR